MKKATITDAKNRLSALIDGLQAGTAVLIMDRGRPVARLEPVANASSGEPSGRLSQLVREGLVKPNRGKAANALFTASPPRPKKGASAVAILLAERRSGR